MQSLFISGEYLLKGGAKFFNLHLIFQALLYPAILAANVKALFACLLDQVSKVARLIHACVCVYIYIKKNNESASNSLLFFTYFLK